MNTRLATSLGRSDMHCHFQSRFTLSTPCLRPELVEPPFLFSQIEWNCQRNRRGIENHVLRPGPE
jgi:hypothetical protein